MRLVAIMTIHRCSTSRFQARQIETPITPDQQPTKIESHLEESLQDNSSFDEWPVSPSLTDSAIALKFVSGQLICTPDFIDWALLLNTAIVGFLAHQAPYCSPVSGMSNLIILLTSSQVGYGELMPAS